MDPRDNPYTPGAGTVPPALTGRDTELERFDVLLERLWRGRTAQSQIVTGLRGVGKTVLLNRFRELADERDWVTVEAEIHSRTELGTLMSRLCRRSLYSIDGPRRWGERARRAAEVLKAFTLTVDPAGSVTIGADVEAASGRGDSGLLSDDLTDVFVELGEAAKERKTGVLFLLDEIQFLPRADLEALILALHKTTQRQLPITLVGAGLPQIPKLAGEAKSYAERLFTFPKIGKLPERDAARALVEPAADLGVRVDAEAAAIALEFTEGYPYFLQELGSAVWDLAVDEHVTVADMRAALPLVERKLDDSFFLVRVERCTELELAYLRAMAELGAGPQKSGEVATTLGYSKSEELGPTRANLISKGLIYTPAHGLAEFTVPQFDRFLRRHMPLERRTPQRRSPGRRPERR
ncbi:MAG TPA: ATP-binding protein [Actinomycetales bacterium]|nr:ATP-binding protein [Actinomycetales bacterium]